MLRIIFLCSCLFLVGCATRVPTETIRADISKGQITELRKKVEKTHESYNKFVSALNLARLYQLEGKWQESIGAYNQALTQLEEYEARALINVRNIASTVGTIFLSRGSEEYFGTGYERSLLHTFNSLNYLMLGDFSGAAVEMRKMDTRQEYWLQESQARIEKRLASKELGSPDELPVQYSMRDMLRDEAVRRLINNYQDPFSYVLSAIFFKLSGDMQSAEVNMRRAIALNDSAGELFRNAWNITEESGTPILLTDLNPGLNTEENPEKLYQEVTIIAFTGLAPALKVEHMRINFPGIGYILLDLPSYASAVKGTLPPISTSSDEKLPLYSLLRTDMLAYRTLWDEAKFEYGTAVSRAITRAGVAAASYAAARSNEKTENYAGLIGLLTTVTLDLFTYSMSGSVRNWETLPNEGYIAMTKVPHGSSITIGEGSNKKVIPLPEHGRGVIILLTELSNSKVKMDYVTY